jgi:protein HIRA/HIR1
MLRGHGSHIVDLDWSRDDALLATASLDNTVIVWDTETGQRVTTLTAHTSFVKGVAWDPIGTYLATQSEDKSVGIWRVEDWSLIARIKPPFQRMLTSTFACRMSWSPDGRFLLAGNSFQGATHSAVAIPREQWLNPAEYLLVCGHGGAVVTTAFCPRLFKAPPLGGGPPGEELSPVFALGAQDRRVSVWAVSAQRPMLVAQRLFRQGQVTDVAWTPDGHAMLVASSDGTVACLQFEASELGCAATDEEMAEVMRELYGSAGGRTTKRAFIESAEQLDLEARAPPLATSPPAHGKAGSVSRPALAPVPQQAKPMEALDALDARLGGGPQATGAVTQTGFGEGPSQPPGTSNALQLMPPPAPRPPAGVASVERQPQAKRARLQPAAAAAPTAAATAGGGSNVSPVMLAPLKPVAELRMCLGECPQILVNPRVPAPFLDLHAVNRNLRDTKSKERDRILGGKPRAEVRVMKNGQLLWADVIPGAAVGIAGTSKFSAVATSDGHVILYTPKGRRASAPLCVGAGISLLAAGDASGSRLLVLNTQGTLRVLDAITLRQIMTADLSALVAGGCTVIDAKLTQAGAPLVSLSNHTMYAWSHDLQCWLRIADDSMAASRYAPTMQLRANGEVGTAQAAAMVGVGVPHATGIGGAKGVAVALALSRGHAECSLAASEALGSAEEYEHWLRTYVRCLVESQDRDRLEELSDSFMGGAGEDATWQSHVLGFSKRKLLKDIVLPEIARNLALGAVFERCNNALSEVEKSNAAPLSAANVGDEA